MRWIWYKPKSLISSKTLIFVTNSGTIWVINIFFNKQKSVSSVLYNYHIISESFLHHKKYLHRKVKSSLSLKKKPLFRRVINVKHWALVNFMFCLSYNVSIKYKTTVSLKIVKILFKIFITVNRPGQPFSGFIRSRMKILLLFFVCNSLSCNVTYKSFILSKHFKIK